MTIGITTLLILALSYLSILFFIAYAVEKKWIPTYISQHPVTYSFAFGIVASSWMIYGSTGMASKYGLGYLAQSVGFIAAFIAIPWLFKPLLNIVKTHKLSSLADLFAFRYGSKTAGSLTAIASLMAILPLMTLQIQAITDATLLLAPKTAANTLALLYCLLIAIFTLLFGARLISPTEKHPGLIAALAFEAVIKLIIILVLGFYSVYVIFGGFEEMHIWVNNSSFKLSNTEMIEFTPWLMLFCMFFIAPFVMPHLFQLSFRENLHKRHYRTVIWLAPIYIILITLPVLPILWGGMRSNPGAYEEFVIFALGDNNKLISLLAYLAGFTASSGMMILSILAIASMSLNHLILPYQKARQHTDIYQWLLWTRRWLIIAISSLAFACYLLFGNIQNLSDLAIVAFTGTLQFLPGLLGVLFWKRANRFGFIIGLLAALIVWTITSITPIAIEGFQQQAAELQFRLPVRLSLNTQQWFLNAVYALSINCILFIGISLFKQQNKQEKNAALACSYNGIQYTQRQELIAQSPLDFIKQLSHPLGQTLAEKEVNNALKQLNLTVAEFRMHTLINLRQCIQANLAGIMGTSVAQSIISQYLPFKPALDNQEDYFLLEDHLENIDRKFTGLAAELDQLRRHHRQTLVNLPLGLCSISNKNEIIMWNSTMADITGLASEKIIGSHIHELPIPYNAILQNFIEQPEGARKEKITINGQLRWLNLTKNLIEQTSKNKMDGNIIIIEDQTDTQRLQQELLHSERLASIGQLAAGVAHEIGNPVTGIDSLAQELPYLEKPEDIQDIANQIRQQSKRISKIVQSLVNFAHHDKDEINKNNSKQSIHFIVQQACDLVNLANKHSQILIINNTDKSHIIQCDWQKLTQVFVNLISNAMDASSAGTEVTIKSQLEDAQLIIEVIDQGSGIEQAIIKKIFDPFFTTKAVGEGTGLGLSLAYGIIDEHGGQLSVHSPASPIKNAGTTFRISLPKA